MKPRLLLALAAAFTAVGCTTIDTDPSTRYTAPLYRTRIDFTPLTRTELENQLQYEGKVYEERKLALDDRLGALKASRRALFAEIEGELTDCKLQRHCVGDVARGGISRFERYQEVTAGLKDLDRQAGEVANQLKHLARRKDLRERALYNRYLVNEILLAKWQHPRLQDLTVHSLEAYPSRRDISQRLARLSDPDVVPELYGDLNFQMRGKPVDEAAVIATFDVHVHPNPEDKRDPTRYFVTFLVNTHQKDPLAYSKGFLREWGAQFGEPGLRTLKEGVYCGLYSIAGPTLVDRLLLSKAKPCAGVREKNQAPGTALDLNRPDAWFLPIAFTAADRY